MDSYKDIFLKIFANDSKHFNLIEFGAGDGMKTKIILKHFLDNNANFTYMPIDISQKALDILESDVKSDLPNIDISPIHNEYFGALHELKERDPESRNVVLFLGSTIGNFDEKEALGFLKAVREELSRGDMFVLGFDLKKDTQVILDAYSDKQGVTREFNMNLMRRMNRELGANFIESNFLHFPSYNPETGETKSFLISKKEQTVTFELLDFTAHFSSYETIYTEVSQKYDIKNIRHLAESSGFEIVHTFYDKKQYFADVVWQAE